MFFIGLSSTFIPYLLLVGFMLVSFVKINLGPMKDMGCLEDNASLNLTVHSSEVGLSIDVYSWESKSDNDLEAESAVIETPKLFHIHQESIFIESSYLSANGILPDNDYFGLSPPYRFW